MPAVKDKKNQQQKSQPSQPPTVIVNEVATTEPGSDPALEGYRAHVIVAEQKAVEEFDKAVMALSGGSLGFSIAFIKDIVGTGEMISIHWLLLSWLTWIISLLLVLISYYVSHLALRKTIEQSYSEDIYKQRPGAIYDRILVILNPAGGIFFIVGIVLFALFAMYNLGK
jgi:hypothetical protein